MIEKPGLSRTTHTRIVLLLYNNNIIKYKNMNSKKSSRKLVEAAIKMNVTYYTLIYFNNYDISR